MPLLLFSGVRSHPPALVRIFEGHSSDFVPTSRDGFAIGPNPQQGTQVPCTVLGFKYGIVPLVCLNTAVVLCSACERLENRGERGRHYGHR